MERRWYSRDIEVLKYNIYHSSMVRAALPLALRCNACGQTVARGKKLYMQKKGSKQGLIFMFKCPYCTTTLSFIASIADGCYLPGEHTVQVGTAAREQASEQPPPKRLSDELLLSTAITKNPRLSEEYVMREYVRQFKVLQRAASQEAPEEPTNLDTRYRALSFLDHA